MKREFFFPTVDKCFLMLDHLIVGVFYSGILDFLPYNKNNFKVNVSL